MALPRRIFAMLAAMVALPSVAWTEREFTAAVFEHRYRHDLDHQTPREVIHSNLHFYEMAADIASEKGVDILVFNEYGLYTYEIDEGGRARYRPFMEVVPDPKISRHNPCLEKDQFNDSYILSTISCMARRHAFYVVANLIEMQPCAVESQTCDAEKVSDCRRLDTKCPDDGAFMYNTDVVFDTEGNLVARYRKIHPYFELVDDPAEPDFVTFETGFGTFGLIVCFDGIFRDAVTLAERHGIDTLVYPLFWFDDIAPFNAVELHQAWALENKVNLLSANIQYPRNASLGSGIFSGKYGAMAYTYDPDGESKLVIAKLSSKGEPNGEVIVVTENGGVPKLETGDNFPMHCYDKLKGLPKDMFTDYTCYKSQTENHVLVKLNGAQGNVRACDNEFCCSLTYDAIDLKEDYYLAVKNFTNDVYQFYHWCEETCLLVRCDPFGGKQCVMQPSTSNTVFRSIEMKAEFTAERVYATVSKNKHRLAPKTEWSYEYDASEAVLKFQSDSQTPLLKAGFFGRCYQRDPPFKNWRPGDKFVVG